MNINDLLKNRRTIRKFKQQPLTGEQLLSYIDAARLAPSAANLQPLKYIAIKDLAMAEKIFPCVQWAGYLAPEYNPKEGERPVAYVVVCADKEIRKNGYEADVGAAVENLILCSLADGVGACWIASINKAELKKILDIPDNLEPSCVVALGYPAESPCSVAEEDGNIKYYLDENGTLCVPKRSKDEVLIKII